MLAAGCQDPGAGAGGGSTSSTSSNVTTSSGVTPALTCEFYCAQVMKYCTAQNQQYQDASVCLTVCATFPPGTLDDRNVDTLGCRVFETEHLATAPDTKCAHAGPSGGDLRGSLPGICGDGCEAFCNLESSVCTGANDVYSTQTDCRNACEAFPGQASSDDFDIGDGTGDTFNCRLEQLTAAVGSPSKCGGAKPSATNDPCSGP